MSSKEISAEKVLLKDNSNIPKASEQETGWAEWTSLYSSAHSEVKAHHDVLTYLNLLFFTILNF